MLEKYQGRSTSPNKTDGSIRQEGYAPRFPGYRGQRHDPSPDHSAFSTTGDFLVSSNNSRFGR